MIFLHLSNQNSQYNTIASKHTALFHYIYNANENVMKKIFKNMYIILILQKIDILCDILSTVTVICILKFYKFSIFFLNITAKWCVVVGRFAN